MLWSTIKQPKRQAVHSCCIIPRTDHSRKGWRVPPASGVTSTYGSTFEWNARERPPRSLTGAAFSNLFPQLLRLVASDSDRTISSRSPHSRRVVFSCKGSETNRCRVTRVQSPRVEEYRSRSLQLDVKRLIGNLESHAPEVFIWK